MRGLVAAVLLVGLMVSVNAQQLPELLQKMRENEGACIAESGVDKALVEKLQNKEVVDDAKLKCFIKCLYTKTGLVSQAGEFNMEELKRALPANMDQAKVAETIGKCGSLKGSDLCDTVFKVFKCVMEAYAQAS